MRVQFYAPKQAAFFGIVASAVVLFAAPIEAYQNNQRDVLLLKIILGIGGAGAGATLLWQHRPSRIDDQVDQLNRRERKIQKQQREQEQRLLKQQEERDKLHQQSVEEINRAVQERIAQTLDMANQRLLDAQADFEAVLKAKDEELDTLRQQLQQADYPRLPPQTTPANFACKAVQLALWAEGLILDWNRNDPATKVINPKGADYDQFILAPRNQGHMVKFLKLKSEIPSIAQYALAEKSEIKISQDGDRLLFQVFPIDMKKSPSNSEHVLELKYPTDNTPGGNLARLIMKALGGFSIPTEFMGVQEAPQYYQVKLKPQAVNGKNIELAKILGKSSDLQTYAGLSDAPIILPASNGVTFDIPKQNPDLLFFEDYIHERPTGDLPLPLGVDINDEMVTVDLADGDPHIFAMGGTGSGKSTWVRQLLTTILKWYSPKELQLALLDPKLVELKPFENVPHLWKPVAGTKEDCLNLLEELRGEVDRRNRDIFDKAEVKDYQQYNEKFPGKLPRILVVIDETPQLVGSPNNKKTHPIKFECKDYIVQLGQVARSAGIHLCCLSQRGVNQSVPKDVQANLGVKVMLKTDTEKDGLNTLGVSTRESPQTHKLLGKGDMVAKVGSKLLRLQTPLIEPEEAQEVINSFDSGGISTIAQDMLKVMEDKGLDEYSISKMRGYQVFRSKGVKVEELRRAAVELEELGKIALYEGKTCGFLR